MREEEKILEYIGPVVQIMSREGLGPSERREAGEAGVHHAKHR